MVLAVRKVIDKLKYMITQILFVTLGTYSSQADSEELLSNHKHKIKVT